MQANLSQPVRTLSLGANHGYRFEGDTAFLHAELAFDVPQEPEAVAGERWALQLWACDAPYAGGPLRGIKVAEAALAGATSHLEAQAPAQLPPAQRDYAMVLVLATDGQVHDFSNYPARQAFAGPHLTGSVGYRFEGDEALLQASVRNPRAASNLSGTLALELWALSEPYDGGSLAGTRLAHAELGSVAGDSAWEAVELRSARKQAPAGSWQLALVLREWTEAGYQTRDYCNFAVAYRVEPSVRLVPAPVAVRDEPASREDSVQQAEAVREAEPVQHTVQQAEPVQHAELAPTPTPVLRSEPAVRQEPAPKVTAREEPAPQPVSSDAPKAAVEAPAPKLARKSLSRVSISSSSVEQLAAVDGLNLRLAQAIVRARPYRSLEDLTRVRGIGSKLLQRLRAELTM